MRAVALHSGGLDSTVLLWHLMAEGYEVLPLSIFYGQRHARELEAAAAVCRVAGLPHRVVDLGSLRSILSGSSQTDAIEVPEGHYADENMKVTVVPNRNMVLLATATAFAISRNAELVAYAAHAGDHAIYPDCRPEFVDALKNAIRLCDYSPPMLLSPFITFTKADIVKKSQQLNVPVELTWSCYKGSNVHCGRCGTCVERIEAFNLAGVADPTVYQDREFGVMVTARD